MVVNFVIHFVIHYSYWIFDNIYFDNLYIFLSDVLFISLSSNFMLSENLECTCIFMKNNEKDILKKGTTINF